MITIVDYSAGNLASVRKAFEYLGCETCIAGDPEEVARAQRIVLPGVGHFSSTARLEQRGLKDAIKERIAVGTPFLGICVGMQWLFEGSEEAPGCAGLGVFPGFCERFPEGTKSPHVGWNSIAVTPARLMRGLGDGAFVYFTHSYRAGIGAATVAVTEYGSPFSAAVERENVFGVQFHPEKSGPLGLALLRNFVELPC